MVLLDERAAAWRTAIAEQVTEKIAAERATIRSKMRSAAHAPWLSMVAHGFSCHGAGLMTPTVREPASFTISAPPGSTPPKVHDFAISIRGVARVRARITSSGNGTFEVVWRPPQSGRYSLAISMHGMQLPGSPFHALAATPEPSAAMCEVKGDALTTGIARETLSFHVSFCDAVGALTHATELDLYVEPVALGSPRARTSKSRRERGRRASGEGGASGGGGVSGFERVKVICEHPLIVRAECEVDSEQLGVLLPGTVVTLLETRTLPGGTVRACIALDHVCKSDKSGRGTDRVGALAGTPPGSKRSGGFRPSPSQASERSQASHRASSSSRTTSAGAGTAAAEAAAAIAAAGNTARGGRGVTDEVSAQMMMSSRAVEATGSEPSSRSGQRQQQRRMHGRRASTAESLGGILEMNEDLSGELTEDGASAGAGAGTIAGAGDGTRAGASTAAHGAGGGGYDGGSAAAAVTAVASTPASSTKATGGKLSRAAKPSSPAALAGAAGGEPRQGAGHA